MNIRTLLLATLLLGATTPSALALDPNDPNDPNGPSGPSVISVGPPTEVADLVFDRVSFEIGIFQNDSFIWNGDGVITIQILDLETEILAESQLFPPSGMNLPLSEEFTSFASSLPCFPQDNAPCNLTIDLLNLTPTLVSAQWTDSFAPYPGTQQFTFFRLALRRETDRPPLTLEMTPFPVADVQVKALDIQAAEENLAFTIYAMSLCNGDVNGDLTVDLTDLAVLLANFGAADATPLMGDVSGDGKVDLQDLAVVLAAFGESC